MRPISATYQDPLDLVWLHAASSLGIRVERSAEVFASWDGCGILRIGTPETLDADDSLAQMVLHELCHLLVEGPDAITLPDWGLQNDPSKVVHEHATLRLQAALADTVGLREFFAATTVFRKYYDQLTDHPLEAGDDPAIDLALVAWHRSRAEPWAGPLDRALRLTAELAHVVQNIAPSDSLWSRDKR
ncbi:MAG: hypothetical protein H6822_33290 [Planctomycetaceae bacterium]|nr:hypothetical protein [Planctomycetales bacterium]MCB9927062.1 hypothetical protein [Planctomycetaceae bacterium]